MNKAGYAYAVAAVRARTERLFSAEEAAWLWTADEPAVKRALQNKGWQTDRPAEEMARARRQEAWAFVTSIAPDAKALRFLLMPEEFCNVFLCTAWQMGSGEAGPVWARPLPYAARRANPGGKGKGRAQAAWVFAEKRAGGLANPPARPRAHALAAKGKAGGDDTAGREEREPAAQHAGAGDGAGGGGQGADVRRGIRTGQGGAFGAPWPGGDNARAIEAAVRGPEGAVCFLAGAGRGKGAGGRDDEPAVFEAWRDGQVLKTAWMLARDSFSRRPLAAYWLQTKAETQEVCLRLLPGEPAHMRERGRLQYA